MEHNTSHTSVAVAMLKRFKSSALDRLTHSLAMKTWLAGIRGFGRRHRVPLSSAPSARKDAGKPAQYFKILCRVLRLTRGVFSANSSNVKPQNDFDVLKRRPRQPDLALCNLPTVILVDIMLILPPESLWALRQSAATFLEIFDSRPFLHLHGRPGACDPHMPFSTLFMTEAQKSAIKTLTEYQQPEKTRCSKCSEVYKLGDRDPRLVRLRELRCCEGCKERHAGIFFSAESLYNHNRGVGKLVCLGQLGQMSLYGHKSHRPITWDLIQTRILGRADKLSASCTYCSHLPRMGSWGASYGRASDAKSGFI
jgi:hypothetical protein